MILLNVGVVPHGFRGTGSHVVLDNSDEYTSQLVTILKAATIRYIHYYVRLVSSEGDLRASLCSVNDASQPAIPGSILGSGTAYSTDTISTLGWKRVQLSSDYSASLGERLFVKIETINFVSTDLRVGHLIAGIMSDNTGYHAYDTGSVTASSSSKLSIMLEDTSGNMIPCTANPFFSNVDYINSSSTPDEVGNLIIAKYGYRVIGAYIHCDMEGDFDVMLYHNASTYSASIGANERANTSNDAVFAYFEDVIDIPRGDSFRIGVKPTSTTDGSFYYYELPTSYESLVRAEYYSGESLQRTYRTDAGSWTEDSTSVHGVLPIISRLNYGIVPPSRFNG